MTAGDAYVRFRALPLVVQLVAGVVLLVAVLALTGYLQGAVSAVRDWAFDREQAEAEAERDHWRAEAARERARAERAEAQAAVYQEEADAQKRLAADAAISAREKARRAEEIGHEADRIAAGADDLTPDAARALVRARLAEPD